MTKYEEEIHRRFYYDPLLGALRYKKSLQKCTKDGLAGVPCRRGYRRVSVLGKKFLVHRVIFYLCRGYWPEEIDHIDQNKDNNRLENLRECNRSMNFFNTRKGQKKGVCMRGSKFRAYAKIDGSHKELGLYDTEKKARDAYDRAVITYAGEFASPNHFDTDEVSKTIFKTRRD